MAAPRYLIGPDDPASTDERQAGGKAASLAAMTAAGFDVPDFCVVTCEAFSKLAADGDVEALRAGLSAFMQRHGEDAAYAVRSSARGEDSAESSFAGLYSTVLDVRGVDQVLSAVKACWASYDNPEAGDYRARRDVGHSAMAVVVQVLVAAEWSGVSFSANPVTLSLGQAVVNATRGLGEALVSGAVNPEEIVLSAASGAVLSRKTPSGCDRFPDELLNAVWASTNALSDHFGFPQDVEWAAVGDRVFILQSRPITNIADVYYSRFIEPWRDDADARPDDPRRVWTRAYADEIWAPPVSPLFYNLHNLTSSVTDYMRWHHDRAQLPPDVFKYHRAAAYMDVEVLRRQYSYHPKFSRIAGILNFFPYDQRVGARQEPWRWWGRLRRTAHFEFEQRGLRSLANNHAALAAMWPGFIAQSNGWFELNLEAMSVEEVRRHREAINAVVNVVSPACGFAVAYHAHDLTFILTGLLDRWFGDGESLYAKVSSGLEGSVTVDEAEGLWRLSQRLRLADEKARAAATGDFAAFEMLAGQTAQGRAFLDEFEAFWMAHRHRGASYKDIIHSRWGDDKGQLLRLVASYLDSEVESPRLLNDQMAEVRRRSQRELLARCNGFAAWRRPLLQRLFKYNEIYMSERDNHRFYFDRVWFQLRRIYRSYGRRLTAAGILETVDDVFFLGSAEVDQGLAGELDGREARARVEVRRRVWERTLRSQPPKFLVGYSPHDDGAKTSDGAGLVGIGASPGVVSGRARIIYDVRELPALKDGEILVTRQTDPAWSTVFARIGGLVLETGGVLAHGASLCREFDLPCVTALENATELIHDGDILTVDGHNGRVTVAGRP